MRSEKIKGVEAACVINKFFCEIGEKLAKDIPDTDSYIDLPVIDSTFIWSGRISVDEVTRKIAELNVGKSSGIPVLGSKILKECLRCKGRLIYPNFERLHPFGKISR